MEGPQLFLAVPRGVSPGTRAAVQSNGNYVISRDVSLGVSEGSATFDGRLEENAANRAAGIKQIVVGKGNAYLERAFCFAPEPQTSSGVRKQPEVCCSKKGNSRRALPVRPHGRQRGRE